MTAASSRQRLITRLVLVVVLMFIGGFALVPAYTWLGKALGMHGNTYQSAQLIDESRQVRVQFVASNAVDMSWGFYPKAEQLDVHPGAVNEVLFIAQNPTGLTMTAQAVPSISPSSAALYFHKTECFCFTQQVLQPGQRIEMPVRFIVDRDLPRDVKHLTLGYTLFDVTARPSTPAPVPKSGG